MTKDSHSEETRRCLCSEWLFFYKRDLGGIWQKGYWCGERLRSKDGGFQILSHIRWIGGRGYLRRGNRTWDEGLWVGGWYTDLWPWWGCCQPYSIWGSFLRLFGQFLPLWLRNPLAGIWGSFLRFCSPDPTSGWVYSAINKTRHTRALKKTFPMRTVLRIGKMQGIGFHSVRVRWTSFVKFQISFVFNYW